MKTQYILLFFFLFALCQSSSTAQETTKTDSLLSLLNNAQEKGKAKIYNQLVWENRNSSPSMSIDYGNKSIKLSLKLKDFENLAQAYSFTGVAYRNIGNYPEAFSLYFKGLKVCKENKLELNEAYALINIGNLYIYQEAYNDAIDYLLQAQTISKRIKNNSTLAYCSLNLGRAYSAKHNYDSALIFLHQSLDIRKKEKNNDGMAVCLKYIADNYYQQNQLDIAIKTYQLALDTLSNINDNDLLSDIYTQIANVFFVKKELQKAKSYGLKGLEQAFLIKSKLRIRNAYDILAKVSFQLKDFKKSSIYFQSFILYNDSVFNDNLSQAISSIKYSAAQEKKQAHINLLTKEKELNEKDIERRKTFQSILISILLVLIGITIYTIITRRQLKINNIKLAKQKKELETLNHEVSSKSHQLEERNVEIETINNQLIEQQQTLRKQHKDITDSINYAKTIQEALLTQHEVIDSLLPQDYFIFYKPKEVVSGDFYYINKLNDKLFFTVADCTGHGVPGGFLTVLGITYLHEIFRRRETEDPAEALEILRTRIKNIFKSVEQDNKNGMDMALCILDTQTHKLQFSGAYNPLWLLRDNEIIEYKAIPNPIGYFPKEKKFIRHEIQLQDKDKIYLFSDGYKDQFGGVSRRKFMKGRLKEMLIANKEQPMSELKNVLDKTLIDWQAGYKQVDDIAILGFTYRI